MLYLHYLLMKTKIMKWVLIIFLIIISTSCDYYDDYFDDVKIIPTGSKSLLITTSINEVENVLMSNGLIIFTKENCDETNIIKVKDLGYFKCELRNIGNYTQIKILYNKNIPDNLEYLKYNNDSTKMIYNHIISTLNDNGLYDIYYEE